MAVSQLRICWERTSQAAQHAREQEHRRTPASNTASRIFAYAGCNLRKCEKPPVKTVLPGVAARAKMKLLPESTSRRMNRDLSRIAGIIV